MKYLSFLLCILFFSTVEAQFDTELYSLKIINTRFKTDYKAAKNLDQTTKDCLASSFNVIYNSKIQLKPVINTGKAHLIEGMDIKSTGNPQLEFHITDVNTKSSDLFVYTKKLSANSVKELSNKLIESFQNDMDQQKALNLFVKDFIDQLFKDNCSKYKERIESLNSQKKYRDALQSLINYSVSNCDVNAKALLKSTLEEQSKHSCGEKLQKASVMVNSGVQFQMKRAIPILLSISPDAPCANDAIELSKKIGEKMGKTSSYNIELSKYQSYQNNYSGWESYYLNSLMRK